MRAKLVACLCFVLLGSIGPVDAAETTSPKLEAVKQYLLKDDYPELFGDTPYRMKIDNAIVADVDDDGEDEVILHVTPHYRQSPTILIFKVSKTLAVKRVIEGLAPGPLVPVSGNYLDSHQLGAAVDLTLGKEHGNPAKRRDFVKAALAEKRGGVVEYANFIHMDSRKGKGVYVDMTGLAKPPAEQTCEDFEFSVVDEIAVMPKKDGSGNYLLARVGKSIYAYKIHKIRDDGFLEKTLTVMPAK